MPAAPPRMPRPRADPVPRPWYVDAALFAAALLIVLAILVVGNPGGALSWVVSRDIGDREAKASLAAWAGGESNLPRSLRVRRARVDPGRDSTYWYEFSVDPADVPALKQSVVATLGRSFPPDADLDGVHRLPFRSHWPGWWEPDELPDADLYQDMERHFVFSRQTGIVYVAHTIF